jgi:hypothetical protein
MLLYFCPAQKKKRHQIEATASTKKIKKKIEDTIAYGSFY